MFQFQSFQSMFKAEWGLLRMIIAADIFRVELKLENLVKGTIAIALGLFEDAQGILQREVMSYHQHAMHPIIQNTKA